MSSYFKTINNTSGGGSGGGGISSQGGIIGGGGSTSTQLPYLQITGSQSTIPAKPLPRTPVRLLLLHLLALTESLTQHIILGVQLKV